MKTDIGLVRELMPHDAKTFLDVGGNDGELLSELGIRATIIDVDKKSLEKARSYGHKTKAFDLNSKEKLPFRNGSFDLVLCNNCLEHVIYPSYVLREIFRISKNYVIVIVPNDAYKLSGRLKILFGKTHLYNEINPHMSPHIQFFDYKSIKRIIMESGFSIEKEVILGKPSIISKNLSGTWSFLCSKSRTKKTETIRHISLRSWCFR